MRSGHDGDGGVHDLAARVSDEAPSSVNSGTGDEKAGITGTCGILTTVGSPESSSEHQWSGGVTAADLQRRCGLNRNREMARLAPGIGGGWHGRGGSLFKGRLA